MLSNHYGICDASGAVSFIHNEKLHFIVANDEDNILRVFQADISGHAVKEFDINSFFTNNPQNKEIDIEAAAEIDGIIYWITSHGTNKKGDPKPERRQLFACKMNFSNGDIFCSQVGNSYTRILDDLFNDSRFYKYNLHDASKIPPKNQGGLNIEGLCSTPEDHLIIGFRNPIRDGKTLLVPLKNPFDIVLKGTPAEFGEPIDLDLNNLGVRSIEYWRYRNQFIIIGGPIGKSESSSDFKFFFWSGKPNEKAKLIEFENILPEDFNTEGIIIPDKMDKFIFLSDDGSVRHGGKKICKKLELDSPNKYFRSKWINVSFLQK